MDFADITVRAQEDGVMWAGDGRPGRVCVCAGKRDTVCLRSAPSVLLLSLEN